MDDLRKRAEDFIDKMKLEDLDISKKDNLSLMYELLVHQRELEIQNEEIRRANLELEEVKNRYIDLYNSSPVGYATLNENGIILQHNITLLKILHIDEPTITGKAFSNFIHKEDLKIFLSTFRDFYSKPEGKTLEIRLKNIKKPTYSLITGKKDTLQGGLLINVTDITEIKESHQKIVNYLNIIEIAPVSIIITDKNNRIIYLNKNYSDITGYSKDELLGKDPGSIKSGRTPGETYKQLWNCMKNKQVWNGSFINKKKDGTIFKEEAKIVPVVDEYGAVTNYVAVKTDITEKEMMEKKEAQLKHLRSLVTISGGIAHHLNNINTPILLMSEDLYRNAKTEEDRKKAEIIVKSVNRSTNIINSILKFSKNSVIYRQKIEAKEILNILSKRFKQIAGIDFNLILNISDSGLKIEVDVDMMLQALESILKNAIESMPSGGDIKIFLNKEMALRYGNNMEFAVIAIEDQGTGIPDHIKPHIFEPFYTTKVLRNATGLGLSEALGIVEQHGGFIDFTSEVNKGTTFKVYIPIIIEGVKK
ncbi:MAG: PAS domain S-box protein [Calditerrivibrio sp.]|nr:PAS domain S-box protein [Calditerrivibrio sp.]